MITSKSKIMIEGTGLRPESVNGYIYEGVPVALGV